ncbi:MAG TPA: DegT/DnrJ/EryC1/StrS aminotransferase family protein [Steroidobacteraceae bacterium]|nr:DegT/DnrJ/EryC1/StrS aminotransferase family protein [Steroidobacteraceae bacterium]
MTLPIRTDYLPFGRPNFSEDEIAAVVRIMRSGWIGQGNETHAFERELAQYTGASDVVTVNSCTSALFLALLVAGTQPGDEVIVPSFTWCSTANAALYAGATPILCDIDPATLNVTPQIVAPLVTSRTRAVIVVHMAGLTVDVGALRRVLPAHVAIIEDAAHALGSRFSDGMRVGATGNLTCFSFYANKNVSTAEGGAVAVTDAAQADRLRSLRLHALPADAWKRFTNPQVVISAEIEELGYKMNYTDLQASIGRVQLARLPLMQELRLQVAKTYAARFAGSPALSLQREVLSADHARHLFLVLLDEAHLAARSLTRDAVLRELRARNIGATIHYHPLHRMRFYARPGAGALPVTDDIARRVLTLPISASMSTEDTDYVADHLLDILK